MPADKINLTRLSQKVADIKQSLTILRNYATRDQDEFMRQLVGNGEI
jgi:hypothetical protein